jgi:hypothetical protein
MRGAIHGILVFLAFSAFAASIAHWILPHRERSILRASFDLTDPHRSPSLYRRRFVLVRDYFAGTIAPNPVALD